MCILQGFEMRCTFLRSLSLSGHPLVSSSESTTQQRRKEGYAEQGVDLPALATELGNLLMPLGFDALRVRDVDTFESLSLWAIEVR